MTQTEEVGEITGANKGPNPTKEVFQRDTEHDPSSTVCPFDVPPFHPSLPYDEVEKEPHPWVSGRDLTPRVLDLWSDHL